MLAGRPKNRRRSFKIFCSTFFRKFLSNLIPFPCGETPLPGVVARLLCSGCLAGRLIPRAPANQENASARTRLRVRFHSKCFRSLAWCFFTCVSRSVKAFLQLARTAGPAPVACKVPVGIERFRMHEISSVRGFFENPPCNWMRSGE